MTAAERARDRWQLAVDRAVCLAGDPDAAPIDLWPTRLPLDLDDEHPTYCACASCERSYGPYPLDEAHVTGCKCQECPA